MSLFGGERVPLKTSHPDVKADLNKKLEKFKASFLSQPRKKTDKVPSTKKGWLKHFRRHCRSRSFTEEVEIEEVVDDTMVFTAEDTMDKLPLQLFKRRNSFFSFLSPFSSTSTCTNAPSYTSSSSSTEPIMLKKSPLQIMEKVKSCERLLNEPEIFSYWNTFLDLLTFSTLEFERKPILYFAFFGVLALVSYFFVSYFIRFAYAYYYASVFFKYAFIVYIKPLELNFIESSLVLLHSVKSQFAHFIGTVDHLLRDVNSPSKFCTFIWNFALLNVSNSIYLGDS
jgi:hypothetical protein